MILLCRFLWISEHLSFREWGVENEKSHFYKWNYGRRENRNKQRTAKTLTKVCTEQALASRIIKDIKMGKRTEDVINRSVSRLKNYFQMDTYKIDVSNISAKEAAEIIFKHIMHKA